MSRTVLAKINGFTPVIDSITKDTGSPITSLVFGRMWRFCQMKDGVCNASLDKIAQLININKATVLRHAKVLVENGYLEDMTPDLRNQPHTYRDTGKAGLYMGVSARTTVAESNTSVDDVAETVAESQLKKVFKKEKETSTGIIFTTYENNIGPLFGMMVDKIGDAIDTYPHQWILDAIQEAVTHNACNWAYIEKILKTWQAKGRANDKPLDKMSDVDKELLRMDIKPAHQIIEEMGLNDVSDEEQKIKNQEALAKIKETE